MNILISSSENYSINLLVKCFTYLTELLTNSLVTSLLSLRVSNVLIWSPSDVHYTSCYKIISEALISSLEGFVDMPHTIILTLGVQFKVI